MAFFRRLRLRWRERRLERKLHDAGALARRAHASSFPPPTELDKQRTAIQRLRHDGGGSVAAPRKHFNGPPTTTLDARDLGTWYRDADRATKAAPVDSTIFAFVEQHNDQRRHEFVAELVLLQAMQRVVPSAVHRIDRWAQRHHESVRIRVRTQRDLARWKNAQSNVQAELVRIWDLVAWSVRLELVDRKQPMDETVWIRPQLKTKPSTVALLPHPEICFAMVVAALVGGVYGLLVLGVLLKLVQTI